MKNGNTEMQQQRFEIHKAPVPLLRAEPRLAGAPGGSGPVQGIEATSGGLIRSTLMAGGAALAILTFFWLPAEYGVDPTGVGGLMDDGKAVQASPAANLHPLQIAGQTAGALRAGIEEEMVARLAPGHHQFAALRRLPEGTGQLRVDRPGVSGQ